MARKGYPAEFRRRVIDLVEGGKKIVAVAEELAPGRARIRSVEYNRFGAQRGAAPGGVAIMRSEGRK